MDVCLRTVAIIIEVLILAVVVYAILNGLRLTVLDLGIKAKYGKAITMALIAAGIIVLFFFIAHLTTFYPTI